MPPGGGVGAPGARLSVRVTLAHLRARSITEVARARRFGATGERGGAARANGGAGARRRTRHEHAL
ncbi:hypothetical protein GCM10022227_17220 [Streptomyces sedi]